MKLRFDMIHTLSYGFWECPDCDASFYGGGPPLHRKECPHHRNSPSLGGDELRAAYRDGYGACTYVFGPKELRNLLEMLAEHGPGFQVWRVLPLNEVKAQCPDALQWAREQGLVVP